MATLRLCACWMIVCMFSQALRAQSSPPTFNVITRITMVESSYFRGSAFSIDVDQREYWITAKHILTGAEHPPYGSVAANSFELRVLDPGGEGERWLPVKFLVIDPGKDIDIVALASPTPLLKDPLPSAKVGSQGVLFGGDCEFLGFPYGGGWRATWDTGATSWMPFVKHCTVSSMVSGDPKIWVLDGINNVGFSGGPVINRTGADQQIFAVVSCYRLEPVEVVSSGTANKTTKRKPPNRKSAAQHKATVSVNSGFIIAYDLASTIEAIHNKAVGPLRSKN